MNNTSMMTYRRAVVSLAVLGLSIAAYFALYWYEVIDGVWDPFFGRGTSEVLTGFKQLPVRPDTPASVVTLLVGGYLLVGILAIAGGSERWRTIPWVVVLLSTVAYLLILIHLMIFLLQPILFHAWSTFCIASALISLAILGCVLPEFLKTVRYLRHQPSTWHTLWRRAWGLPGAE